MEKAFPGGRPTKADAFRHVLWKQGFEEGARLRHIDMNELAAVLSKVEPDSDAREQVLHVVGKARSHAWEGGALAVSDIEPGDMA